MTAREIAAATGGEVVGGDPDVVVEGFGTDSRTIVPGSIFVAVRGARDGHDFVDDALARGAVAALVERDGPGGPRIRVPDTLTALATLARSAREGWGTRLVVGVTGSTGKTSTKDLCAGAFGGQRRVHASPASFNNEIGVPLTVLGAPGDAEVVVAEMGARGVGHIRALCDVVRPQIGIVTGIGAAHTALFGTLDDVALAKGELLEALPPDGWAILGGGHEWVDALGARSAAPVVRVGMEADFDVRVGVVELDPDLRPSFDLETPWGAARVTLEMRGAHQAVNAGLAAAAALVSGLEMDAVVAGLATARGSRWRMEVVHSSGGLTILNDSYNANPASTAAAVEALTALPASGLRWAVLGHMAELGGFHDGEHRRIGGLVAEVGVDRLVVVGDDAAPFAEGAAAAGVRVDAVATPEDALDLLRRCLRPGDAVLVKASRVVGLERVVEGLLDVPHRALPTLTDADARPDVASPDISGPDVADPGRAGRERG